MLVDRVAAELPHMNRAEIEEHEDWYAAAFEFVNNRIRKDTTLHDMRRHRLPVICVVIVFRQVSKVSDSARSKTASHP
jgi:hypothetical protein